MHKSLAVALLLLQGLGVGCPAEPKVALRPDVAAEPTPEQDQALRSALHRVHLDAKEPAVCADCHRIEGPKVHSKTRRCLGCHEKNTSAVHRGATSEDARECLTCHDFLAERNEPWACSRCHTVDGQGIREAKVGDWASKAPVVKVHAAQSCKLCHAPHGENAVHLADCTTCHQSSFAAHHPEISGPAQCAECHVGHRPKEAASESCKGCHEKQKGSLPGHPRCVSCHAPHDQGAGIRPCASCHQDGHAREMFGASQPRPCKSCHDAHQSIHEGGTTARAGACSSCHLRAASDTAFHGDRVPCASCHVPGKLWAPAHPEELCARCHGPAAAVPGLEAARVKTVKGHDRCTSCHLEAHEPTRPPPICASCHARERASAAVGHDACQECHRTHDGGLKKSCVDCHAPQATGPHQAAAQRCTNCHRAHGPRGAEAPQPCVNCHALAGASPAPGAIVSLKTLPLPGLHAVPQHRSCPDCHQFHELIPAGARSSCVGACHEALRDHFPEAQTCRGCHAFKGLK